MRPSWITRKVFVRLWEIIFEHRVKGTGKMRRILFGVSLFIACLVLTSGSVNAAEEEKPLAPGWLSLDSTVGLSP